jgi:hypothetical protein
VGARSASAGPLPSLESDEERTGPALGYTTQRTCGYRVTVTLAPVVRCRVLPVFPIDAVCVVLA